MSDKQSDKQDDSRRKFVKTLGYVAPAIITLKAVPAFAAAGSGFNRNDNHNNERHRRNDRDDDGGGRHQKGRHRRD